VGLRAQFRRHGEPQCPYSAVCSRRPTADGQAEDPSGSLDFAGAVERQLGLKLEMHKRPLPVLVIEHMEEKPIEK
jgi:uncharacterized protein (TIGR03435 family)